MVCDAWGQTLDHQRLQPLKIGGHWPEFFEQLRGLALREIAAVHAAEYSVHLITYKSPGQIP